MKSSGAKRTQKKRLNSHLKLTCLVASLLSQTKPLLKWAFNSQKLIVVVLNLHCTSVVFSKEQDYLKFKLLRAEKRQAAMSLLKSRKGLKKWRKMTHLNKLLKAKELKRLLSLILPESLTNP